MKQVWLLIVLFFMIQPGLIKGQSVNKGSIYIGAIGSWSNFGYFGFSAILVPRFEYLVQDKLSIGSDLGFSYTYTNFSSSKRWNSIIVSPFVRYYFLNKKLSPIAEVSYYHAFNFENPSSSFDKADINTVYMSFGVSTPGLLLKRVGLDLTTGFAWDHFRGGSRIRFAPITSLRITYRLRKK